MLDSLVYLKLCSMGHTNGKLKYHLFLCCRRNCLNTVKVRRTKISFFMNLFHLVSSSNSNEVAAAAEGEPFRL